MWQILEFLKIFYYLYKTVRLSTQSVLYLQHQHVSIARHTVGNKMALCIKEVTIASHYRNAMWRAHGQNSAN